MPICESSLLRIIHSLWDLSKDQIKLFKMLLIRWNSKMKTGILIFLLLNILITL